jgi:hypothetical protein
MGEKEKTIYYFECSFGCGLREAKTISQARKEILEEVGTHNIGSGFVRKARKEDIEWVNGMGGYTPSNVKGGDNI